MRPAARWPAPARSLSHALPLSGAAATPDWAQARRNGRIVDDIFRRTNRMMHRWLSFADPKTMLLPDRLPGVLFGKPDPDPLYTPHNSGADNYPFLIITACFTEPGLVNGAKCGAV